MTETYDVIVVGAGPGGSTAATYLGKMGKKVLLIDKAKFPRDKTCGDALSGKSMRVIREFGLTQEIEKLPHAAIRGVTFSSPSGAVVSIPFAKKDPNRNDGTGYCMRRIHTDNMFFGAARREKNVVIKEKFQVNEVMFEGGYACGVKGIDLASNNREEIIFNAKVIVGADGVNSNVAKAVLGKKAELNPKHSCDALRVYYDGVRDLTQNIEIHFLSSCQPGYFWIFPLENGTANVGLGLVSADLQKKMKTKNKTLISMLDDAIANEPLIRQRFVGAKRIGPVTGWRLPFGSHKRQLAGDGWVLVGDAASLVDPFSGEGVGNATASARMAASVISNAIDKNDVGKVALCAYEKEARAELGPELNTSYRMQQLGSIKWLLNKVVEKAATKQEIKDLISASLANEDAKKNFKNPLFYIKVLFS
ncbi:MAG: NAD(P)/FAD-dependent oxidoreductase [Candidatus Micrarchaeia archaeon]